VKKRKWDVKEWNKCKVGKKKEGEISFSEGGGELISFSDQNVGPLFFNGLVVSDILMSFIEDVFVVWRCPWWPWLLCYPWYFCNFFCVNGESLTLIFPSPEPGLKQWYWIYI
jgi:hypothetical protein